LVNVRIAALTLFFITLLAQTFSGVSAQNTSISHLSYPSGNVAGTSTTVTFDLTYTGLNSSDLLVAAITDPTASNFADGIATSTPDQCISLATTQYLGKTLCAWQLSSGSGAESVTFNVQFPGTHIQSYGFAAVTTILTGAGTFLGVSKEPFSVTGGTTFELTVNTSYPVALVIDGSNSTSSPVELTPGQHVVSVPAFVQIDNSSRLRFDHWEDGSTQPNRTLNIRSDTTIAASFVPQYLLSLSSSQVNATGAGWYDDGSSAQFSVPSLTPMPGFLGDIGARWVFKGWWTQNGNRISTSNSGTVSMYGAHTLDAQWVPDYSIPTVALTVIAAIAVASATLLTRRRTTRAKRKRKTTRRKTTRRATRRITR
jgi:hypothetical protein